MKNEKMCCDWRCQKTGLVPGNFSYGVFYTCQIGSFGSSGYFGIFNDDNIMYCFICMLNTKNKVFRMFIKGQKFVQNPRDTQVRTIIARESVLRAFRTDNSGERMSSKFAAELEHLGVEHQRKLPFYPHQNGLAARFNQTLTDLVRSMLHHKKMPNSFWAEALNVAVCVRNQVTCEKLPSDVTPLELWSGQKPEVSNLCVFATIS